MSHRNILIIFAATIVSLVCFARAERSPYGRYVGQVIAAVDRWALEPVEPSQLFDGALQGIVGQLDEYSSYISAGDTAEFEADIEQQFGGIGVMIKLEGDERHLTVVSPPLYGTPAMAAGIRVRDRIVAIDGESTEGMGLRDVIQRMRGPRGEPVTLRVLHDGDESPVTMVIVRDTIRIPSVLGDRRLQDGQWIFRLDQDPRIGYLRLVTFGEKTVGELRAVLDDLAAEGVQALLIDLRDNSGGLLQSAVETCDMFLPGGKLIVSIRGRDEEVGDENVSTGQGPYVDIPLAILVNGYSASASEIVAACLQDHDRAVIVGERTFGKGTVQHVIPIEGGKSILKLTAASYWRPSGRNIHRLKDASDESWGVAANDGYAVELTDEQQTQWRAERIRRDLADGDASGETASGETASGETATADPQLQRAVEYLHGQLRGDTEH